MEAQAIGDIRLLVGQAEPVAGGRSVGRVPDGLVQVAQIQRTCLKRMKAVDGQPAKGDGIAKDCQRRRRRQASQPGGKWRQKR